MNLVKRFHGVIIIAVILAVSIVAVLSCNSDQLALRSAGFSKNGQTVVSAGIDQTGQEYKVVVQSFPHESARIAYLRKGFAGFWKVTELADTPTSGTVKMFWVKMASFKRYTVGDPSARDWEVHSIYCGNNASKQILPPTGALPHNVTVNISQAGSSYMLHFIGFGETNVLDGITAEYVQSLVAGS